MGGAFGDLVAVFARQHIGQRGFTGPVRPHDRVNLTGFDFQIDTLQDLLVFFFQFDLQAFDAQHDGFLFLRFGAAMTVN